MPRPLRRMAASLSAFHPSSSANFSSNSAARIPSSSVKSSFNKKYSSKSSNIASNLSLNKNDNSNIIEVFEDNFQQEMKNLISLIKEYNYIGMDTEFPGTVFHVENMTDDFYYKSLKKNVDKLKLIQLGITLTNEKGEYPKNHPYHTWQFSLEFDKDIELYKDESVDR